MKKNLKLVLFSVLAVLSLSFTAVFSNEVRAENAFTEDVCSGSYSAEQKAAAGCDEERTAGGVAVGVINVVLSIVGIIAVIMLIVGGTQYIMSNGDPSKITKTKQIILYSVIGLMVSLLAFAIVNFVLSEAIGGTKSASGGSSSGGASTGGGSSVAKSLSKCDSKTGSICNVNGVAYTRLEDKKLWAVSSDKMTFEEYEEYECPEGTKKPSESTVNKLAKKYKDKGSKELKSLKGTYWVKATPGVGSGVVTVVELVSDGLVIVRADDSNTAKHKAICYAS